jgi:hypothetical protein
MHLPLWAVTFPELFVCSLMSMGEAQPGARQAQVSAKARLPSRVA